MVSVVEQAKKHQPLAKIENWKLIIKVGRDVLHPMEESHLINQIDILKLTQNWLVNIKSVSLQAQQQPIVEIPLSQLERWTYKIQARCNLHWTWEDEILIS
jgi:desulfoferrodoxin (superoxide reductase-like protein)